MSQEGIPQARKEANLNISLYEKMAEALVEKISAIKTPLAHGTTSEHLEGILGKGLGSEIPENAFDGDRISLTDLKKPGGLFGAYSFARMNPEELSFQGEEDSIARYIKAVDIIPEDRLRE